MEDNEWGEITQGLAISISVAKPSYKRGEAISLNIALKNFSEDPVPIVIRSTWIDFSTEVFLDKGNQLPKLPYAVQMMESALEGRRMSSELKPGAMIEETLELTTVYDMTTPGAYSVIVTRTAYHKGKMDQQAVVASKELAIQVTP